MDNVNGTIRHIVGVLFLILSLGASSSWALDSQINAGDALKINVYNNPDLTTETRVSDEGLLSFPLIGDIKVEGLSAAQAEKKIAQKLIRQGFLREAQVNVNVIESNGRQVAVLGEVRSPGKYPFSDGVKTIIDFLASARGRTQDASDHIHILKQKGVPSRIVINIDQELKLNGVRKFNAKKFQLSAGDVIYVPKKEVFYIYGEVNQPGSYPLREKMNVAQALALGGGITPRGTIKGLEIKRMNKKGKMQTLKVNESTLLRVDDVLFVDESLF
jgi:polysaccharide export outer membrane protein